MDLIIINKNGDIAVFCGDKEKSALWFGSLTEEPDMRIHGSELTHYRIHRPKISFRLPGHPIFPMPQSPHYAFVQRVSQHPRRDDDLTPVMCFVSDKIA